MITLLFALVLSVSSAPAATGYLQPTDLDYTAIIAAPPKEPSAADREATLAWQKKRSAEDCARIGIEKHAHLGNLFGPPLGPLTENEVARLDPFFAKIFGDGETFVGEAKQRWKRDRPLFAMHGVKTCRELMPFGRSYSFPSGHAADSRLFARVLGEIYPDRRGTFLSRADQVALDRVIAGVHYASDVAAGKKLGDAIFSALLKNPSFETDLWAARGK